MRKKRYFIKKTPKGFIKFTITQKTRKSEEDVAYFTGRINAAFPESIGAKECDYLTYKFTKYFYKGEII